MTAVLEWLSKNWLAVLVPLAVFLGAFIVLNWLRRRGREALERWAARTAWAADDLLLRALVGPSLIWCLILSAYPALTVSMIPPEWKEPAGQGLWTLFVISMTLSVLNILTGLVSFYGPRVKMPRNTSNMLKNIARVVVLTVAFLILLDVWGAPTTPLLLLIAVGILAAALAFRDTVPNFLAGFQISAGKQIKVGDYIKLETGEEGYVLDTTWRTTRLETLDEKTIIIPNGRLVQGKVINYGRPLKKAKAPFHFSARTHLTELTGLKASDLRELAAVLKRVPDSVVYYHTHRFLEEYHQLTPEPSNDFAVWAGDALGEEVLSERLASIDTFAFPSMGALRDRVVSLIDDYVSRQTNPRQALEGRAFYFMKSVSVILPAPYVAHDLREFVEALRKISPGSLYFHVFESRLRLGRGLNDFSIWLSESLDDKELSDEVARLDPYTYTLEGLRSALIQLMEKRIK